MTKPSEVNVSTPAARAENIKPSTVKVAPKQRKSEPVRNPAFREHEGLRALQRELNSTRRPAPRKNK